MKKILLFLMFLIFPTVVFAMEFSIEHFGEYIHDTSYVYTVIKTIKDDDGYVVMGKARNFFPVYPFIAKFNFDGELMWVTVNEHMAFYIPNDIALAEDGGYIGAGTCGDPSLPCLFKFDETGYLLWTKTVDGSYMYTDSFYGMEKVADGYVAVGKLYEDNLPDDLVLGGTEAIITKYTENGDISFTIPYGGSGADSFSDITKTDDGGFLLIGSTTSSDIANMSLDGQQNSFIVKYDENFSLVWQKAYLTGSYGSFSKIEEDMDGNIVVLASKDSSAYIYKMNSSGSILWNRSISGNNTVYFSDMLIREKDYIIIGVTNSTNISNIDLTGSLDSFVVIYKNDGQLLHVDNYAGPVQEQMASILESPDGDYVIFGSKSKLFTNILNNMKPAYLELLKFEATISVEKNTSFHGQYDVQMNGYEGVVITNPDDGYEVFKVFVSCDGSYLPVEKKNDKYYFSTIADVSVNVIFKQKEDNDDESILKKSMSLNKYYVNGNDIYGMENIFSNFGEFQNNRIFYFHHSVNGSFYNAKIELFDKDGKKLNNIELANTLIYDIKVIDDYLYVFVLNNDSFDENIISIKKYDSSLNLVKQLDDAGEFVDIFTFFELNLLFNPDFFVVHNGQLYVYTLSGIQLYNKDLELQRIIGEVPEMCEVLSQLCIMSEAINKELAVGEESILGEYENSKNKLSHGVVKIDENKYQVFIRLYDSKENIVFTNRLAQYELISHVMIIDNYIIGIGYYNDLDYSEIFVMDFEGNIIEIMGDSFVQFKLKEINNQIVTLGFSYEDDNTCNSNNYFCSSVALRFYDLFYEINVVGKDGSKLLITNSAKIGQTVTVQVENKLGYKFEGLKIIDSSGNVTIVNGKSFVMPDSSVQIEPIFNPIINPDTGAFISISFVVLIGFISFCVYRYGSKKQPILKI